MGQMWDRAYLQSRIDRCKALAAQARIPEIRTVHLGFAKHYEKLLEGLPRAR